MAVVGAEDKVTIDGRSFHDAEIAELIRTAIIM